MKESRRRARTSKIPSKVGWLKLVEKCRLQEEGQLNVGYFVERSLTPKPNTE
jgi:hypothetical protein